MRTVWKIVRRLLMGIVALILLLIIWFIASSFYEETLDPNFNNFFHTDAPVPDEQNGYLALSGIDAPNEAKMVEYGRTISERYKQMPENYSYIVNNQGGNSLNCWISPKSSPDKSTNNTCITAEKLTQLLAENAVFLKNYRSLYRFSRFQRNQLGDILFGSDLIRVHELSLAQLVLTANQGNAQNAMAGWIADTQFIQRLMPDKASMIDKAIFLVLYAMNIEAYPLIASQLTPEQLAGYKPQLYAIFDTPAFGAIGWDVAATMRWEKEFIFPLLDDTIKGDAELSQLKIRPFASYKPQATRNGFYEFAHDLVELSQTTPAEMAQKDSEMREKYNRKKLENNMVTFFLYNTPGKLFLSGVYAWQDLLLTATNNFSRRQLLKLYTEARIARISAGQMKQFLATSLIKNPLTSQPFKYDEAKQLLSVVIDSQMRFELHYNEMPTQSTLSTNK
ncbi:MAG: hypothetical protein K2Q12_00530 [Rickettsiales bacterium]|nr:hypothetical protein [Rickettsiales bacterium]